ncbi:MAG: hypothetical protein AAB152_05885 [Candidatus Coatesbacteria bacterium]
MASSVWADPAPGTPGSSGNANPHGSPPGQGGAVPGNSGGSNPHGTPPGQRIPGDVPGQAAPPVGGNGPEPVASGARGRAIDPFLAADQAFLRTYTRERDAFIAGLSRLRGWEPGWTMMAAGLSPVRVDATFHQTAGDGEVFELETAWWKDGVRELGRAEYVGNGRSEWRVDASGYSQRWDRGPWNHVRTGTIRAGSPLPRGWDVLNAWEAEPGTTRRVPGGRMVFRMPLRDHGGAIELEAQEGSWLVETLRGLGPAGRLVWHETRRYEHAGGRALLVLRERRVLSPVVLVQVERCRWRLGASADPGAALVALEAQ